jgi:hypothetical protein
MHANCPTKYLSGATGQGGTLGTVLKAVRGTAFPLAPAGYGSRSINLLRPTLLLVLFEIPISYGIEAVAWSEYALSMPFESTAVTT